MNRTHRIRKHMWLINTHEVEGHMPCTMTAIATCVPEEGLSAQWSRKGSVTLGVMGVALDDENFLILLLE